MVRQDDFQVERDESVADRAVSAESAGDCLAHLDDSLAARGDLFRLDERLAGSDGFQE